MRRKVVFELVVLELGPIDNGRVVLFKLAVVELVGLDVGGPGLARIRRLPKLRGLLHFVVEVLLGCHLLAHGGATDEVMSSFQVLFILLNDVRKVYVVTLNVQNIAPANQFLQCILLQIRRIKTRNVVLQILHYGLQFVVGEDVLSSVICEELHEFLFHEAPVLLVVKHLVLVLDFVHYYFFDDVLEGHDTYHLMSWIATFSDDDLSHNTDVSQAFLEVTEQWLQLVIGRNGHCVAEQNA